MACNTSWAAQWIYWWMAFKCVAGKPVQQLDCTSRHRILSSSSAFANGKALLQPTVLQILSHPKLPWSTGQKESSGHSCTAQRRSPGVITSKCHTAETSSEFQGKVGTLHKPVCCSCLPSTGTNITRATIWSLNTGVGFLFCAPHSYRVCKIQGAHLFPIGGSRGWEIGAAPVQMQHHFPEWESACSWAEGVQLGARERKVQLLYPLWQVFIYLDVHWLTLQTSPIQLPRTTELIFLIMKYEQRESVKQHWKQILMECSYAQD